MKVLLIVGTVREGRNSIHVAEAAEQKFEDAGHEVIFYDLAEKEIPHLGKRRYKEDEKPTPEDIEELGEAVEEADTVLIVSPEYNHSIPGILKTALDYLYPEYEDKPFCYITLSAGGFGGVRSLNHLRDITLALNGFPGPHLPVSQVTKKVEDGKLVDQETGEKIDDFVDDVERYLRKLNR